MSSVETRRQFIQRLPLTAVVAGATSFLLSGCSGAPRPTAKEPQTQPEKDMYATLQAYNQAQRHPEVPYTAAVVVAQYALEGRDSQSMLAKYDQIKAPYRGIFADYGIVANLAYGASRFNYDPNAAIGLFETAKSQFTLNNGTPGDVAILAMARGGDVNKPLEVFGRIANDDALKFLGTTTSFDSVITLASAGLVVGVDRTLEDFKRIRATQAIWSTDRSVAVLALASALNGDSNKVLDAFARVGRHNFDTFMGLRTIIETSIATLALAGALGTYSVDDVLTMYEYARKTDNVDTNTATRLALATAARNASHPVISRRDTYLVGKVLNETVVPIALS